MRILREDLYLSFARLVSLRSTCRRQQNGAVITSEDMYQIYAIGYNGSPRGFSHDCDLNAKPGSCGCIHAEINAILKVPIKDERKIMFCTTSPCETCAKYIIQSGFSKVYFIKQYRLSTGLGLLTQAKIETEQWSCQHPEVIFIDKLLEFQNLFEVPGLFKLNKGILDE